MYQRVFFMQQFIDLLKNVTSKLTRFKSGVKYRTKNLNKQKLCHATTACGLTGVGHHGFSNGFFEVVGQRFEFGLRPRYAHAKRNQTPDNFLRFGQIKVGVVLRCAQKLHRQFTGRPHLFDVVPLVDKMVHIGKPIIEPADARRIQLIHNRLRRFSIGKQQI